MATSTYKTFLMHKNASNWEKLIDVTEVPDLGSAPEMLETTTLSDKAKTYIDGLQDPGNLAFTANYTKEDFGKLKALEGVDAEYAVWMGGTESENVLTPDGSEGKFSFHGKLTCFVSSQGTNAVRHISINIAPSTVIDFE